MEQIPTDYNGFIEKAVAAANEHQKGAYDWQAEKRKSFIEGASYGYQFYASLCEWKEKEIAELKKECLRLGELFQGTNKF